MASAALAMIQAARLSSSAQRAVVSPMHCFLMM
jgi:hypothetical protein